MTTTTVRPRPRSPRLPRRGATLVYGAGLLAFASLAAIGCILPRRRSIEFVAQPVDWTGRRLRFEQGQSALISAEASGDERMSAIARFIRTTCSEAYPSWRSEYEMTILETAGRDASRIHLRFAEVCYPSRLVERTLTGASVLGVLEEGAWTFRRDDGRPLGDESADFLTAALTDAFSAHATGLAGRRVSIGESLDGLTLVGDLSEESTPMTLEDVVQQDGVAQAVFLAEGPWDVPVADDPEHGVTWTSVQAKFLGRSTIPLESGHPYHSCQIRLRAELVASISSPAKTTGSPPLEGSVRVGFEIRGSSSCRLAE